MIDTLVLVTQCQINASVHYGPLVIVEELHCNTGGKSVHGSNIFNFIFSFT